MAKDNPAQYGNIVAAHRQYIGKEREYIQQLIQEHPGEKFDPKDSEHQDWYERNEGAYDQDDFDEAYESMIEDRVSKRLKTEITKEQKQKDAERRLHDAQQHINATAWMSVMEMAKSADDTVASKMEDRDGRAILSKAASEELERSNPMVMDILKEESEPLALMVMELEKLKIEPGTYRLNDSFTVTLKSSGTEFPVHKELQKFISDYERSMLARPPAETVREGKRLVSNTQMADC